MEGSQTFLRRRLTLPLLVLYGVGVTIGAGIYVLIGAMAGHAGTRAPLAFVLAGIVMGLTAASYAELCTRFPVSAGEAAYVKAAFRSRFLSTLTGSLTIVIGVISSAAVAIGSAGYIREFIDVPQYAIVIAVVLVLGLVAAWGILESVLLAGLFTLVEIGGLVAIIVAGTRADIGVIAALPQLLAPPLEISAWAGIYFASLLAFFAFIGFEDLANVVEEVREPERNHAARDRAHLADFRRPLFLGCRHRGARRASGTAGGFAGATQPGVPGGGRHQPGGDQCHRDHGDAQHRARADDHGIARDLRHG